jgi:hypothetical protein
VSEKQEARKKKRLKDRRKMQMQKKSKKNYTHASQDKTLVARF